MNKYVLDIIKLVRECLPKPRREIDILPSMDLVSDLGMTSLDIMTLTVKLETYLGMRLSDRTEELIRLHSVGQVADFAESINMNLKAS